MVNTFVVQHNKGTMIGISRRSITQQPRSIIWVKLLPFQKDMCKIATEIKQQGDNADNIVEFKLESH